MDPIDIGVETITLVRLRERAQITLPQDVRDVLNVKQGDYLEAEVVAGGVLLRPVAMVESDAARERLKAMLSGPSRWIGPGPEPSDDELMREIVIGIKEDRRKQREGNH